MKISLMLRMTYLISILMLLSSSVFAKNTEFPGREKYPTVPYISLADFHKFKDKVIVVDVRSKYEHQTLRIKNALNIPLAAKTFIQQIQQLRDENKNKKIIVYCNGKTCMKSYKAALKCKKTGIKDVVSFDAGIMDWAKNYPNDSVLLGESPLDTNKLITKKSFKKYLISPGKFESEIGTGKVIVLDVRDPFQRNSTALFHGKEHRVYINDATGLDKYIAKANSEGKTLLIYDEVGKQVRWLQYYLEGKGAKSYSFMKGGVRNYYQYLNQRYQ